MQLPFDETEAPLKLPVRLTKRVLRVDLQKPCKVDEGEEQIAELLLALPGGTVFERFLKLRQFLPDFGPDLTSIGPVESNCCGPLLHAKGALQGREPCGDSLEARATALLHLQSFPGVLDFVGRVGLCGPEHVRMPPNEFVRDPLQNLGKGELALLLGNGCVHDDMQQEIPEFGLELIEIVIIERMNDLIGLFDQTVPEGTVCLATVPRAFAPKTTDDPDKLSKRVGGDGVRTW